MNTNEVYKDVTRYVGSKLKACHLAHGPAQLLLPGNSKVRIFTLWTKNMKFFVLTFNLILFKVRG